MNAKVIYYSLLGLSLLAVMPCEGQAAAETKSAKAVVNLEKISPEKFKEKIQELQKDRDKDVMKYARDLTAYIKAESANLDSRQIQGALTEVIDFCSRKNNKEALTLIAGFLDSIHTSMANVSVNVASHFISKASAVAFNQAESLYQKNNTRFDDHRKATLLSTMAKNALNIKNDAGFNRAYSALFGLQSAKNDDVSMKRMLDYKINNLCSVLELLADKDFARAEKLAADPFFSSSFYNTRYALAAGAVADLNRAGLDKMIAEIKAKPDSPEKDAALLRLINGPLKKTPLLRQQIQTEMQKKLDKLTVDQQIQLLSSCRPALPGVYGNGLGDETGIYASFKDYSLKIIEIADKNDKNVNKIRKELANGAWHFGDYRFLNRIITETIEKNPRDVSLKVLALQNAVRRENWEDAERYLAVLNEVKNYGDLDKKAWQGLVYLAQSGRLSRLDKKVYGSDWKEVSLKDRFALRRRISRFAVITQHYKVSQDIFQEIMEDFFKEPRTDLHYTVEFQKNAPQSAAAWAGTKAFNEWYKMETRMAPLDMYFQNAAADEKFLKDVPDNPIKPETKNGIQIVYDLEGVHLYARAEDPNIEAVRLGKMESPGFECFIRPGSDSAYNWFFFANLPECSDYHTVQWSGAGKDYKLTYDFLKKDACLTRTGYALHAFIPWEMFPDKLPSKNRQWILGYMGNGGSVNGYVHELERALKLDFDIPANVMVQIMKNTGLRAFYRYKKLRDPAYEFIRTWESDKDLGDARFYEEELADFIKDLDEAGARLEKTADADEIREIYTRYAPLWHNIRYEVAERRTKYLRKKIMNAGK